MKRIIKAYGLSLAAVAMLFVLLFAMPSMAQDTRTHKFFEGVGEAGAWLFERGSDAFEGLGDATDPQTRQHNEAFKSEVEQYQEQWNDELAQVADIIDSIDEIPGYCRAPAAIEIWPAMPDECLRAMDMHLVDVQNELELMRNEIKAELQMGGGG